MAQAEEKRQGEDELMREPFQEGFNVKTVLAALFIGFLMIPGAIYMGLISGTGIGGAAQWVTLILFIEVAKRAFVKLKRQEIYIIYIVATSLIAPGLIMGAASLVLQGGAFSEKIWQQYLIQSPYAKAFGLADKIPRWVVPPAGSEALIKRTFFDKAWVLPIVVLLIHQVLFRVNFFGMGYVLFRLTSDMEKLPFPMAAVAAEGATALAETSAKAEGWRWRIFSMGAMIGVVYGLIYVLVPTFTGVIMAKPLMFIPIPWIDGTAKLGTILPASIFGLGTDLSFLFTGFLLPFWVVVGTFVGSIGSQLVMNPLLYKYTDIIKNWRPGMTVIPTSVTTTLDFWLSITIGTAIVVFSLGVWKTITAFRGRRRARGGKATPVELPKGRGDIPIGLGVFIWFVSTLLYVILCKVLVPRFPTWLYVVFGFILTPILSYTSARMFGITGVATGVSFPMVREGTFILSGYRGVDIWFAPVPYFNHGVVAQGFKQLELTRTKFGSWVKAEFMALGIMLFCSFLFWSLIWKMGPIPSSTYPYVQKLWPYFATFKSLWATSTLPGGARWMLHALNLKYIFYGVIGGGFIYALITSIGIPVAMFYGIVGGIPIFPHYAIPMFAGALLGRFYFAKRFGAETWRSYTPILLAGYACGFGLVAIASISLALIAKSVLALIF